MFSLRTAKGRLASAALVLLAFTMAACPSETDPAAATSPTPAAAEASPEEEAEPDVEADEATDEEVAEAEAMAAVSSVDYGSCHDYSTAGGASDGVFAFAVPGAADGATVEVDVTLQDGARSETLTGAVEGERVVVLAPLSSFGETVEVAAIRVDGVDLDLSGLGGTSFTVDPASDCENHPEEE